MWYSYMWYSYMIYDIWYTAGDIRRYRRALRVYCLQYLWYTWNVLYVISMSLLTLVLTCGLLRMSRGYLEISIIWIFIRNMMSYPQNNKHSISLTCGHKYHSIPFICMLLLAYSSQRQSIFGAKSQILLATASTEFSAIWKITQPLNLHRSKHGRTSSWNMSWRQG